MLEHLAEDIKKNIKKKIKKNRMIQFLAKIINLTYMAILVKVVICQFQFVERKRLFHPMGTGSWRIRMDVESTGHVRFCFSCDDPF